MDHLFQFRVRSIHCGPHQWPPHLAGLGTAACTRPERWWVRVGAMVLHGDAVSGEFVA
jgi:hypothetical protein